MDTTSNLQVAVLAGDGFASWSDCARVQSLTTSSGALVPQWHDNGAIWGYACH